MESIELLTHQSNNRSKFQCYEHAYEHA